ncbi:hypothetical protein Aca07nite_50860 [Actinoplanes capillaceus]|uniref:Uncharacterized protein n=1 Tax=Actinoplanes campanulatus TaxID=113559 RepID=A0ABQ3WNI9_9ACTN|nr:hypothetical protein [Actinoplanes capillaceus]GID47811.1 hypothetical protein Aca07nite_50860 [Actinoplanes capillaceus]
MTAGGFGYVTYGTECDPGELVRFLDHAMTANDLAMLDGMVGASRVLSDPATAQMPLMAGTMR